MKKLLIGLITALLLVSPVLAKGSDPDPYCVLEPNHLSIFNLDPDVPFSVTLNLYPSGTTIYSNSDGTYEQILYVTSPTTVYVWVRGHGPSLIKAGAGLNDYHVIAICSI